MGLLLMGFFFSLAVLTQTVFAADAGVSYQGFKINKLDSSGASVPFIYVKPNNGEQDELVYCFNLSYEYPPTQGGTDPNPQYKKEEGTADKMTSIAVNERLSNEDLRTAILKVIYYGHPNDKDGIMKQFSLSEVQFHDVTQKAIWHFTDKGDGNGLQNDAKAAYDYLIDVNSKTLPDNIKLNLFTTSDKHNEKQYQNLLSATILNSDGSKHDIKTSIFAKKVWQGTQANEPKPNVNLELQKKVNGSWTKVEVKTVATASDSNESTVQWDNLDGINSDYRVVETDVPAGYRQIPNDKLTIGNQEDPFVIINEKITSKILTKITANKTWVNAPAAKPDVYFAIFKTVDGVKTRVTAADAQIPAEYQSQFENIKKLDLTKNNLSWEGLQLPKTASVSYSVEEVDKDGNPWSNKDYLAPTSQVVEGSDKMAVTITNTYQKLETATITAKKLWSGFDGKNTQVTFRLVSDNNQDLSMQKDQTITAEEVASWTVDKSQLEHYSVVELDARGQAYKDGDTINLANTAFKVAITSNDSTQGKDFTITNTAQKLTKDISFSKVAHLNGEELVGADISILKASDQTVVDHWTSTTSAHQSQLLEGSYIFRENAAPAGYQVVTDIGFTVNADGTITVTNVNGNELAVVDGKQLKVLDKLQVVAAPKHDILISKTDLGGQELAGASILITKADGSKLYSWTSTNQGQQIALEAGTYIFHEEAAPKGYLKVTDITFVVDDNGHLTVTKDTNSVQAKASKNHLSVVDEADTITEHGPDLSTDQPSTGGQVGGSSDLIEYEEDSQPGMSGTNPGTVEIIEHGNVVDSTSDSQTGMSGHNEGIQTTEEDSPKQADAPKEKAEEVEKTQKPDAKKSDAKQKEKAQNQLPKSGERSSYVAILGIMLIASLTTYLIKKQF